MKLGRTLGIATRVAGGILRDRASRIGQSRPAAPERMGAEPPVEIAPPEPECEKAGNTGAAILVAEPVTPLPPSAVKAAAPVMTSSSVSASDGATQTLSGDPGRVAGHAAATKTFSSDLGRAAGRTVRATKEIPSKTRLAVQGARGFGRAVWGPLSHTGGILWQEVTGLFFAMFALFFLQNAYEHRMAWRGGPEHDHFLLYVALTALFLWFSGTSFFRARRRSKQNRPR